SASSRAAASAAARRPPAARSPRRCWPTARRAPRTEARAIRAWAAALLVAAFVIGCATTSAGAPRGQGQEGRASYYAPAFAGRRTASGERYDPNRMTAAHKTLPFGTWIRVTRHGGPSVEVRVNDRCGCGGGRIVDLSEAAARRLGMLRVGIVPVRLEVIAK